MFSNKPTSHRYWPSQTILNLRCPEVWFNLWNTPAYGHLRLPWRPTTPLRDLVPCVSSEAVCAFKVLVFQRLSCKSPACCNCNVIHQADTSFGPQRQHTFSNIYVLIYAHHAPNHQMLRSTPFHPPLYTGFSVKYIFI
jgi:hypothetical protein